MIIEVVVKANAKENKVEKLGENKYSVKLKAPREKGKANVALTKHLSKHFGKRARIISGFTSKHKIVEIK